MPTGYRNGAGVDLEDLFEAGTVQAAGFRLSNGANIRFAARGSATKAPNVGFRDSAGSDLSNLWLPKGSAPPVLAFDGQSYAGSAQAPTGATAAPTATLTLTLAPSGAWTIVRFITGSVGGNGSTTVASGTWLPSGGVAANYEVQFGVSASGGGDVSNGAPSFAVLSSARSVQLSASVAAASVDVMSAFASIVCQLRRTGQAASGSTCSFSCQASGYL